ncbi:unnamed protein product [Prorocentrum cordatum]|uniref:Uncharacterized protein n=1 Tax=Prorocentrum cordatum TaxID=2364126 RepID=A0ABN9RFR5_9DINO|nr:unnamed protein product [Polarella glacialis]
MEVDYAPGCERKLGQRQPERHHTVQIDCQRGQLHATPLRPGRRWQCPLPKKRPMVAASLGPFRGTGTARLTAPAGGWTISFRQSTRQSPAHISSKTGSTTTLSETNAAFPQTRATSKYA